MQVDKKRFLLLTAAIAGCSGGGPQPQPVSVADYDTTGSGGGAWPPEPEPEPEPEAPPAEPEQPLQVSTPSEGADPACDALRAPGPTCESFRSTVDSCKRFTGVLVPEAAAAASACLTKKSGSAGICKFGVDADCAMEATKKASPDASARNDCRTLLSSCANKRWKGKDLTQSNCQSALAGYQSNVRGQLMSCINEFCEIRSCFYQVSGA